jgi:hypothetical protein
MVELNYNITDLPDYPALQQLARALWRNGSVRGASVLVGAGLSKNAERPGDDTPEPPLWWELIEEMVERLYPRDKTRAPNPEDKKRAPSNPLRVAEEYRRYFGQAGLDDFLRTRFPDKSWSPGPLHHALLELPWSDVLTTNWDTLLERAAEGVTDYAYEVVRTEADLPHAHSPRIVKLHGTIGDPGPLIFAQEDYRTYPTRYAAFVNLARQVFIENELCLIGFSGDDPNFLQWAGWVRDHLGDSARRIYLVGNLRLEPATRKYLEAHNIAPIDLARLVKELSPKLQHATATRIFLEELKKAKPASPHEWKLTPPEQFPLYRAGGDAYQRVHKDHEFAADLLKKTIPLFKEDRENYPGWLVCPVEHRRSLGYAGDAHRLLRNSVLDLLEPKLRAVAVSEILWRRTTAFTFMDMQLFKAIEELVDQHAVDIDPEMRLEFALALMRDARVSHDDDGMRRWGALIEAGAAQDSNIRQMAEYQWCLRARDKMDLATLGRRLAKITSGDPVWKLRRGALHAELGEYAKATRLIKDAAADLERRHRLDRNSLAIKSQLAWASWIGRACDLWASIGKPNRPAPSRDFKELDIDPRGEIEYIEDKAVVIDKERQEEAVAVRPAFEAGHYREGNNTIHFGSGEPGINLMFEFDQLTEHVGIPLHINHVNVCADAALAAVELAYQPDLEWYVWLFRALHSHSDKTFERRLSRIGVARMPVATASSLISTIEAAVTFWTHRYKDARAPELRDDWSCAHDALRLSLMMLSRLTVRMTVDQAIGTLRRATEMSRDPQIAHLWLMEALGELAKQAVKAVPPKQREALVLTVLEFPLPSEKGGQIHPTWPRLIVDIWKVRPDRDAAEKRWDHRIDQLIAAARKGQPDRQLAILQLAYLAHRDALKPDEAAAFGKALWSDVDAQDNGLPANTGLNPGILQKLPAANGIDAKARVTDRLLGTKLPEEMRLAAPTGTIEVREKVDHLVALANAAQFGFGIPPDRAAEMFEEIVAWLPQQVRDGRDPLAASFAKDFNKRIAASAGYLLMTVLVPALKSGERTEQRARSLLAFIGRTGSWPGLRALPYFLPASAELTRDVISALRTGVLGSDVQHVANAALAVVAWAKLVHKGALPELPRSLLERLIATIEARRAIGLSAILDATRSLLELGFLEEEDLERVRETISEIRREVRYENVPLDTMDAVSASLVRASCVKLAVALKDRVADDGKLQAWIDEASTDPLPEVRFSLTEPFEEDAE